LCRECTRKNTNDSQRDSRRGLTSHDRHTATLREGQFASLELIIIARLLPLLALALAVVHVRGHQQFKAHTISAL
jgi:hypothetical protein